MAVLCNEDAAAAPNQIRSKDHLSVVVDRRSVAQEAAELTARRVGNRGEMCAIPLHDGLASRRQVGDEGHLALVIGHTSQERTKDAAGRGDGRGGRTVTKEDTALSRIQGGPEAHFVPIALDNGLEQCAKLAAGDVQGFGCLAGTVREDAGSSRLQRRAKYHGVEIVDPCGRSKEVTE